MYITRACRALALLRQGPAVSPLRCLSSSSARHFEWRHLSSRPPPRPPNVSLRSHRNLSASTCRRAQYSRFDDHPNGARPTAELQRRDVIIYTLGAGSIVYYIFQCVIICISRHRLPTSPPLDKSLEQVPETGRWRFMDVSPKFEASVSTFPTSVHIPPKTVIALGSILYRALKPVPWKAPPAITCPHAARAPRRLAHLGDE